MAGHELDLDHMERLATDATAVLLSSPHNPTGHVFTAAELAGIASVAERHDLTIVSDEIHADLVFEESFHLPIASLPEAEHRTVTIMAASKTFNIAGIGCGIVFFGSPQLAKQFATISAALIGRPRAVNVRASAAAWRSGRPWLESTMEILATNRSTVGEWAIRHDIGHVQPEATYLAWLDFRGVGWDEEPHERLLRDARVALSPGLDFGPGAGFARLNFATSPEILDEALDRMDAVLSSRDL